LSRNNRILNPLAQQTLDKMKFEVAKDLGLINKIYNQGWENMTTREVGKIGGNMVKKMIKEVEDDMINNSPY